MRAALERIIEKAGEVDVTAAAVVAAVQAYSKINATGRWIDRSEHVNLNDLFERMTLQELEAYAQDGSLPTWFTDTVSTTAAGNQSRTGYPVDSVYHGYSQQQLTVRTREDMKKREQQPGIPATDSGPEPADFPLGSVESRAAVRAMINRLGAQNPKPEIYRASWVTVGRSAETDDVIYDYHTGLPLPSDGTA